MRGKSTKEIGISISTSQYSNMYMFDAHFQAEMVVDPPGQGSENRTMI
jgi:hypothetical protein